MELLLFFFEMKTDYLCSQQVERDDINLFYNRFVFLKLECFVKVSVISTVYTVLSKLFQIFLCNTLKKNKKILFSLLFVRLGFKM